MIRSLESGEVEDCAEKVFEDILAKNFPKIMKDIKPQIRSKKLKEVNH